MRELKAELQNASGEIKEAMAELVYNEKKSAWGELVGGLAHELNQPLNCINIIAQGILRDIDKKRFQPDEMGKDLSEVVLQVGKMTETINQVRIFSRRQEGVVTVQVDVNHVIEAAFKLVGQRLKAHNINYSLDLGPALPKIKSDPGKLEQVLLNVIFNARDAIQELGKENGSIQVRSVFQEGPPARLVISIADNGGGIPVAVRDMIFDPFFTTKRPGTGAGLGLWISRKLMEELEGKIELDAREGDGCQFSLVLPLAHSQILKGA